MCGILGFYNSQKTISSAQGLEALASLAHRGPDGQGLWLSPDQRIGLGHRRLSINDKAGGSQPLINRDRSLYAVVNGEFYDYGSLRADLETRGHPFTTSSDSELLIHLYQEYDLDCLHYLRGEFAFILYDQKKSRLFAARDRFGIKPLCYAYSEQGLQLASEAKALFKLGLNPAWNESALYHAFSFQYLPMNQSLFQDIQILPAGSLLLYEGKQLHIRRYWDLNYQKATETKTDLSDLTEQLEAKLKEAIALRLHTEAKDSICCHLSGGVDSASIAALASELSGTPLPCFSVAFTHSEYNELPYAQGLAQKIGAPFHPIEIDAEQMVQALGDAVYYSEGLAINNHLAAKFILNREIKKRGFKIALTGEGADELFAGYLHLQEDFMPQERPQSIASALHLSQDPSFPLEAIQKKLGFIPSFIRAKAAAGYKLHQLLEEQPFDTQRLIEEHFLNEQLYEGLRHIHPVHQSTYLWIHFALSGYILKTLGDGCEMAQGIEGRAPFLDHHLFEFTKQIPLDLKIRPQCDKFILRETVKKYLTPEIVHRQKQPFIAPPFTLLENKLGYEFMRDCLQDSNLPFLNRKKLHHFLDELPKKSIAEQRASEPPIMLLLTATLLGQAYGM